MATTSGGSSTGLTNISKPKKSMWKCCFVGCGRTQNKNPELHFFKFPVKRPSILEQWLISCGNEKLIDLPDKTLQCRRVCEKHFTPDCFTNDMRKRLKPSAIPTIPSFEELETDTRCQSNLTVQSATQTTVSNDVPLYEIIPDNQLNEAIHSQGQLTSTHSPIPPCHSTPSTPRTPLYKKLKSSKNRTPTPRKTKLTPVKRKLLHQLRSSQKKSKKFQTRANRLSKRTPKITKDDLVEALKEHLPPAVSNFVSMQLNHAKAPKRPWSKDERRLALTMSYKSPSIKKVMRILRDLCNAHYPYLLNVISSLRWGFCPGVDRSVKASLKQLMQMRKDGFALPSKSTIARWLQEVDFKPGICQDLLNALKDKVDCMTVWEKKSSIMFDEMTIKTGLEYDTKRDVVEGLVDLGEHGRSPIPGTKVLLFMVRGLIHKWKMPFAYYIVNDSLTSDCVSNIVTSCTAALIGIGLDIKSVICDQSSTNRSAAQEIGVSLLTPFFSCAGKKVYWIYDIPHVIKCIRNNLMKTDKKGEYVGKIKTSKGVADWTHVIGLYEIDISSSTARATKLTDKHLCPNNFEKMSVKLATQVFSHSVSTAMTTAVETGQLPPQALETATFLKHVNDIFDSLNSRGQFDPNPYKCALSGSKNEHLAKPLKTIESGLEWVRSWRMAKSNNRPPSFVGFEHSMKAIILLWNDIEAEGVKFLLTSRVNQDPLENEFSIARERGGYNQNPTARLFRQSLRHRIRCALLQPPTGSNCEPDEDSVLQLTVTSSPSSGDPQPSTSAVGSNDSIEEDFDVGAEPFDDDTDEESGQEVDDPMETEVGSNSTLEDCAVRYFAGYAVRACLKKYKCEICETDLLCHPSELLTAPDADEALIRNRQYVDPDASNVTAGLKTPSQETTKVAKEILCTFQKMFDKNIHRCGIKNKILHRSKQHVFNKHRMWMKCGCDCYYHRIFVMDKIITAHLHRRLQAISKDMRQPGGKHGKSLKKVTNLKGF